MRHEAGKHFDPRLLGIFLDDIAPVCDIHERFGETHSQ